jgi:UDP:flavonoid glycosyltransferase YjiC (YdhE family)
VSGRPAATGSAREAPGDERPAKILFATSNGTGLGHLNRAMSIARRLPPEIEPVLFTLSQAVPAVVGAGFRVEYFPSYRRPASGSDWQWNLRLRKRFEKLLADERPDLVVFDGVHPYRALTHVLSAAGAPRSVWCRRPLWRPDSPAAALKRSGAFDSILEPGELASAADRGPTVARRGEALTVGPMVYLDADELLSREDAARKLGLDPDRPTALVNLGQGGAVDGAVARVLERLGKEPELQVAALQSSIGKGLRVPEEVVLLDATFPMSRYFKAFDFAVAASGYNAFHEQIAFGLPSLFVPMPRNTDDQAARAKWGAEHGVARAVAGPEDEALLSELEPLLAEPERERLREGCAGVWKGNGAVEAAKTLSALARGERPRSRVRKRGGFNRWWRYSSNRVGPSLPLALALTARDLLRHPERRRPKAIVYALGQPDHDFEQELKQAVTSLGVPRGRVIVITDSLELALMRRLGLGFQRIPAARELGLGFDDRAYRRLLEERFDLAMSPWHGKWPMRRIGTGNEILRQEAAARKPAAEPSAEADSDDQRSEVEA